ncbi:MAG: hypothetical protein JO332_06480 [Planctomycetaceae bacterium]|nr:hypothetical protein [Planctomycetaceae bacterium]
MIKVQPAHSRMTWSEGADRIRLDMPPPGFWSSGGCLLAGALVWIAFTAYLFLLCVRNRNVEFAVIVVVLAVPGALALLVGAAASRRSWSLERDSAWLTFRRRGLFGERLQRWPAGDVAAFYVREALAGTDMDANARLVVGFRNGRSADIVQGGSEEELQWVAAMLREPRGERKAASPLILAAEPERRKVDPEIVPTTLTCRTFESGVEVTFLPLLRHQGAWWKLPLTALLGTIGIVAVAVLLFSVTRGRFPPAIPRIAIAALIAFVGWRIWVLSRSGVVQILDGIATIVQNQGKDPVQFGVGEIEFVQTYRVGRHTELQFLLKDKPKVRVLEGRPGPELEWAARFLRVAIKGRTAVPENAPMKVDAAAGDCQVCLEKMDRRVVYCGKCRTPHHEECWSYMGMCSTYGCREIRFERA